MSGNRNTSERRSPQLVRHPELVKAEYVQHLPTSWGTLYELSKLDGQAFAAAIDAGGLRIGGLEGLTPSFIPSTEKCQRESEIVSHDVV